MKLFGKGFQTAAAASALCVFLAACGGSEPASSTDDTTASTADVEAAVSDTTEDVVDAATDAADTAETAVDDAADAATEAADDVVDAAADAAEDVAEDVEDAATDAVEEAADTAAAADDRVSAEVVAQYAALTGDAANGRRVFTQCMACHAVQEGRNMAGPSMYGIIGRPAGTVEGFRYSDANANSGIVWTEPTMFAYLEAPQQFIPGTIMAFPGLRDPQDRADVIAYLKDPS